MKVVRAAQSPCHWRSLQVLNPTPGQVVESEDDGLLYLIADSGRIVCCCNGRYSTWGRMTGRFRDRTADFELVEVSDE
jgi:hypothetical protein